MRPRLRLVPMFAAAGVLLNVDAAIACNTKPKAYVVAMKSDLRNMADLARSYRSETGRSTADLHELGYKASSGVGPLVVHHSTKSGFAASITHPKLAAVTCFVAEGDVPASVAMPSAPVDGEPWCVGPPPKFYDREVSRATDWVATLSLLALTLSTAAFLPRRGRRNWPAIGLGLLTAVAFLPTAFPTDCRTVLSTWLVMGGLGAAIFATAVLRRLALQRA